MAALTSSTDLRDFIVSKYCLPLSSSSASLASAYRRELHSYAYTLLLGTYVFEVVEDTVGREIGGGVCLVVVVCGVQVLPLEVLFVDPQWVRVVSREVDYTHTHRGVNAHMVNHTVSGYRRTL